MQSLLYNVARTCLRPELDVLVTDRHQFHGIVRIVFDDENLSFVASEIIENMRYLKSVCKTVIRQLSAERFKVSEYGYRIFSFYFIDFNSFW